MLSCVCGAPSAMGQRVFMGACAPQQSHRAIRPGCACKLAVPGVPVWGTGQGRARDPRRSRCTRVCLCQEEGSPECQTWARVIPGARGGRHAEPCACACKCPRGGHVHRASIEAGPRLDLAPEPVRGQGLPGLGEDMVGEDIVGALLVLALAALLGEAPRSRSRQAGEEQRRKK